MEFKAKFMQDIAYENHDVKIVELIKNKITDSSRWSIQYYLIFKILETGKFYSSYYSVGATEYQDEGAYEYDTVVECVEVMPKKVEVTQYVEVKT